MNSDLILALAKQVGELNARLIRLERLLPALEEAFCGKVAPDGSLPDILRMATGNPPPLREFTAGDMP